MSNLLKSDPSPVSVQEEESKLVNKDLWSRSKAFQESGSKYDPIIDRFLGGKFKLIKVDVTGKDADYVKTQLQKRIDTRSLRNELEISMVNGIVYIEKKFTHARARN